MESNLNENCEIVVYSLGTGQIAYIGELCWEDEHKIKIGKPLVSMLMKGKDGNVQSSTGAVPYASRDSVLTFNVQSTPGILIKNPDPELLDLYKTEIIAAYSKLTLV